MDGRRGERVRLALAVWAVLVSQVLVYPGVSDLVVALGGGGDVNAGMWFLVAEFAAFVLFAGVWGAASDALGRRRPLVVLGAVGGAGGYLLLAAVPSLGLPFAAVLLIRALGGAMTIGAFSLSMTALADLAGGNGRNMGAAGIAIGLGAALGSVVGGRLSDVDPLYPLYGAAVLLVAAAALVATIPDRTPDGVRLRLGPALSRLSEKPALAVPYAFGFIDRMTAGFFALVGVYYFRETFGLDAFGAGLALSAFFFPFALLQYPAGVLSDRVGRFGPVVVGSLCFGFAIVGVGLAPTLELAVAGMVVVGVFGALVSPATMALVTDVASPEERGAALGGFNIFGSLGFLAGFVVGGVATSTAGYLAAFVTVGFSEVAIAVVASRAVRRLSPTPTGGVAFSAND
ncbi:MFS transporter [Halopelagius longus]|uniref:MFS transporter n=1 Tax=Halopelagius longus TaxID=1236180 RepID=A0A1H1BCF6_9EURY|nr:MFS transporter [Halopelagius longus]RDI70731.1 MFS transporter [Halopelagius longus]SDQ49550.1 Major Facilitator Superfamily protein [Halopelagius longus]